MKIKSTVLFLFFSILAFGQSPEKFTYQSIIKNSSGYLLKNQEVGLRISILFNSSNGAEVYSEEHFPTSNSNGLVTVIIGEGLTGDNISNIDWGNGEYFIKVEVDPEGGINYTMNQTSQLLSVPYALYAENSGSGLNLLGQDFITLSNQTLTVNKVDLADDVDGILPITNGGTGSDTAPMVGVITAADEAAARSVLGLGTAATTASTDYATAAQGALADTALQAANNLSDLADAATSRTNLGLGTAATTASTDYATAAQGALADTALQATNNLSDLANAAAARTALGVDASGTDNSTNVTLATVTDNYLSLSNQEITAGTIPVSLGGTGSTTAPMVGVITAANAAAARTALGVDASGTDNSTNVTLANTNYLSISGQEITGGTVPLSSGGTGATTAAAARTALGLSSLSIGASSGAGAVDINSEQLRIVGTLNEIETSATNQTIQVSLPSYIYVNLVGDVQGDVIGSLSGSQVSVNKIINPAQTVSTAGGTITLNGMSGRFRISALSTSATINNDIISSNSVLICTISSANSNDYFISSAVPGGSSGSGSFTVTLDQIPAYDVDINFFIMN
jgi:hypothetical protein